MMHRARTGRGTARVLATGIVTVLLGLGAGSAAASGALSVAATALPVLAAGPPLGHTGPPWG